MENPGEWYLKKNKKKKKKVVFPSLDQPLVDHRISDFHESSDVCSFNVIDKVSVFAVFNAGLMDLGHDPVEFLVNLFPAPGHPTAVL
jgi:hypothetical protein